MTTTADATAAPSDAAVPDSFAGPRAARSPTATKFGCCSATLIVSADTTAIAATFSCPPPCLHHLD